jgi:ribosome biogenesis GTPase
LALAITGKSSKSFLIGVIIFIPLNLMQGLVIKSTGSWYQVYAEDGELPTIVGSKASSGFKGIQTTNPIAVGDKVGFELEPNADTGVIDTLQ